MTTVLANCKHAIRKLVGKKKGSTVGRVSDHDESIIGTELIDIFLHLLCIFIRNRRIFERFATLIRPLVDLDI